VARDAEHEKLEKSAISFLRWTMQRQSSSGFFPLTGFWPRSGYSTHAISYTLEGLLGAAREIRGQGLEKDLVASAMKGCVALAEVVLRDGTLYGEYSPDFTPATTRYICVPGLAQVAWCLLRAYTYSGDAKHFNAAVKLLDDVKSLQLMSSNDGDFYGSLPGSAPIWGGYQRWRIVTWGAKFLADALLEKKRITSLLSMESSARSAARLVRVN
jgi:hypothetical protein